MRFLVDECAGPAVAQRLRELAHEVLSVFDEARGLSDDEILKKAHDEEWILITNDKDFGEMIYREQHPHRGVVLLRLQDERLPSKLAAIEKLLNEYPDQLPNAFVVVSETQVRFAQS